MQYKTCKHQRHFRCHDCSCGAWCENDDCLCGCHDTPMFTMQDFLSAQWNANEADTSLKIVQEQQLIERSKAESKLIQLNTELAPFKEKHKAAEAKLQDMKRRLLSSWQDSRDRYTNSKMYVGGNKEWYNNRVWLRLANYRGLQWEVRIQYVDSAGCRDFILGPPIGLHKEDLEINKRKAEVHIAKMGYIIGS